MRGELRTRDRCRQPGYTTLLTSGYSGVGRLDEKGLTSHRQRRAKTFPEPGYVPYFAVLLESPTRSQGKKTTRKEWYYVILIPPTVLGAVPAEQRGSLTTVTTVHGLLCSATRAVNCRMAMSRFAMFVFVTRNLLFKARVYRHYCVRSTC